MVAYAGADGGVDEAAESDGTRTASMMWMMEAPALMLATVTRAELEAPLTLTVLPDVDKARLCPFSRVPTEIDPDLGTSEEGCGAPRMWY